MTETVKAIRPCENSFQYCDGNCSTCDKNSYTTSTSTSIDDEPMTIQYRACDADDGISKPTKEQYEKSKETKMYLYDWIRRSKKRQEELLDELVRERTCEKDYRGLYEAHKDLVRRYELYEEIEANDGKV